MPGRLMAADIKAELLRPLALILAVFAALGWVLFVLSSWSAASTQKTQRLRIVDLTERNEKVSADLAKQVDASASLADLQSKVAAAREDLTRVSQTRSDVQTELLSAQRNLSSLKRDVTETNRSLESQQGRLSDLQTSAEAAALSATAERAETSVRSRRGGRRSYRRGRQSRSFAISRNR